MSGLGESRGTWGRNSVENLRRSSRSISLSVQAGCCNLIITLTLASATGSGIDIVSLRSTFQGPLALCALCVGLVARSVPCHQPSFTSISPFVVAPPSLSPSPSIGGYSRVQTACSGVCCEPALTPAPSNTCCCLLGITCSGGGCGWSRVFVCHTDYLKVERTTWD